MAKDYSKYPWETIKLESIKTPKEGAMCYADRWWTVTPDDCILRYGGHSMQCNSNKDLSEQFIQRIHPECRLVFVEMAFIDDRDWKYD